MILRRSKLTPCYLALCAGLCLVATMVRADSFIFGATTDFPVINAGEVPYYAEASPRNSLAIYAANEDFRDRFARATLKFEGASGFFDITLTTLAELDGEAPYRVLINDVLVGSATNPEVTVDYTPVRHTFEHIVVPKGATIAVESLANTNGKIPEGDGTAFARGRWTTLELANNDEGGTAEDTVDLSIIASAQTSPVMVGESRILTFDIANATESAVATQPIVTVTRPRSQVGVDPESMGNCIESGNDIICNLSEIPAGQSETISLTLIALQASPSGLLRVVVSADQTDSDTSNDSITLPLQIVQDAISEEASVSVTENGEAPVPETDNENENANAVDSSQAETPVINASNNRSSGGGASGASGLILLAAMGLRRRYNRARVSHEQRQSFR